MSTPDVLDFEKLLAPVSEESPTGVDLQEEASAEYYELQTARETARNAERQLAQQYLVDEDDPDFGMHIEPPNWRAVVDLATDLITAKSKDLWVTAFLMEGLVRRHGFAGLRDGFRLVSGLCDTFWEQLHPRPVEGDMKMLARLGQLNGEGEGSRGVLVDPIRAICLLDSPTHGELSVAKHAETQSLEAFHTAMQELGDDAINGTYEDARQALEELGKLTELLDEKCGEDERGHLQSPPSSNLRRAIEENLELIDSFAPQSDPAMTSENGDEDGSSAGEPGQGGSGPVASRQDAFERLRHVADYFERSEPHSPVSYAIRQVIQWGRMSLPDLMRELIADESTRDDLFRRTGIPKPREEADD